VARMEEHPEAPAKTVQNLICAAEELDVWSRPPHLHHHQFEGCEGPLQAASAAESATSVMVSAQKPVATKLASLLGCLPEVTGAQEQLPVESSLLPLAALTMWEALRLFQERALSPAKKAALARVSCSGAQLCLQLQHPAIACLEVCAWTSRPRVSLVATAQLCGAGTRPAVRLQCEEELIPLPTLRRL